MRAPIRAYTNYFRPHSTKPAPIVRAQYHVTKSSAGAYCTRWQIDLKLSEMGRRGLHEHYQVMHDHALVDQAEGAYGYETLMKVVTIS